MHINLSLNYYQNHNFKKAGRQQNFDNYSSGNLPSNFQTANFEKGLFPRIVNLSPDSNVIKRWNMVTKHISYLHLTFRVLDIKITIRNPKQRNRTYVCQQSRIICATTGLTSSGISSRLFWNPTAPTTCIGFKPCQGILVVVNSHKITPKLYTSHLQTLTITSRTSKSYFHEADTDAELTYFSLAGSFLKTSGAIHSGCRQKIYLVFFIVKIVDPTMKPTMVIIYINGE